MNKDEYLEELLNDLREQQKYLNHINVFIVIGILIIVFELILFFVMFIVLFK